MHILTILVNALLCMLCIDGMAIQNEYTRHITQHHLYKDFYGLFEMTMDQFKGENLVRALQELKRKYKKLCLYFHPDKNPGDPNAKAEFQQLAIAYQTLKDDVERQKYNDRLFYENLLQSMATNRRSTYNYHHQEPQRYSDFGSYRAPDYTAYIGHITTEHLTRDFFGLFQISRDKFEGNNLGSGLEDLRAKYLQFREIYGKNRMALPRFDQIVDAFQTLLSHRNRRHFINFLDSTLPGTSYASYLYENPLFVTYDMLEKHYYDLFLLKPSLFTGEALENTLMELDNIYNELFNQNQNLLFGNYHELLTQAYETLRNAESREEYDEYLLGRNIQITRFPEYKNQSTFRRNIDVFFYEMDRDYRGDGTFIIYILLSFKFVLKAIVTSIMHPVRSLEWARQHPERFLSDFTIGLGITLVISFFSYSILCAFRIIDCGDSNSSNQWDEIEDEHDD